ncbi:exported hypothetical protein [Bradyrhizobium sp. STM 3843]|nr:exported hypothetical protein [Bradyrhizobium sp. STM 3843]
MGSCASVAAVVLTLVGLLVPIPGALSQSSPGIKCHGTGNITLDDRIAGCTALIESSAATLKSLNMARLRRAMFQIQKGEIELAIADYDEILTRDPDNVPARLARASAYLRKHDNDAAIADYNRVIEADHKNIYALNGRALVYLAKENPDGAIADYGQILLIHPENVGAYVGRSGAYRAKHDWERALADCGRAIEISPEREYGYLCRGAVYLDQDQIDHAVADFERATELNPKNLQGDLDLASAHERRGDMEAALARLDQAFKIDADNAVLCRARGVARLESGRSREAFEDFSRAAELRPKDSYAQLWLDLARRRSGDPSELAESAKQLDMSKWPAPVIRYYLGGLTFEALLVAADDSDPNKRKGQVCEANFYAGELTLANGARDEAIRLLRVATEICPRQFVEWPAAHAELRRLGAGGQEP